MKSKKKARKSKGKKKVVIQFRIADSEPLPPGRYTGTLSMGKITHTETGEVFQLVFSPTLH